MGDVVTIKDVASQAGVSVATVSRALRGVDGVSADTRDRIRHIADQLQYLPSRAATSLVSGRTHTVAVVAPFRSEWALTSLVSAISTELWKHDHHAILIDLVDHGGRRRQRMSAQMLHGRVDGVITLNLSLDEGELTLVDRLGIPLVHVGGRVAGRPSVHINDAGTTRTATEHLIAFGHSRIAYLGWTGQQGEDISTHNQRMAGFVLTMQENGYWPHGGHLITSTAWTAAAAAQAMEPILARRDRPSAVLAESDEMAFGVLQIARRVGLKVPEDLSVMGMDDHALAEIMDLTTMRQDLTEQGRTAASMLLRAMADHEDALQDAVVSTQLIVRGTTARADNSVHHPGALARY